LWIQYFETGERKRGALPELPYPELLGEPTRGVANWRSKILPSLEERADSFLFNEPIAAPIERAFDQFGLNRSNPFAWRLLIYVFSEVHFGSHRSAAGAPKKWTPRIWCDLLSDFNQMKERNPKLSEAAICGHLKNNREFQKRHPKVSAETLRRNLQYARDPKRNIILNRRAQLFAEDALRPSGDLSPEKQAHIFQEALHKALQDISTAWKRRAKIKT
jgi:hypothetical protein